MNDPTIAAPLNLITTATAFDALPAFLSPTGWAIAAVAVVVLVGAFGSSGVAAGSMGWSGMGGSFSGYSRI